MDTVRVILKEEGTLGLWKGTSPTLVRIIPGGGLYFLFLHNITLALSEGTDLVKFLLWVHFKATFCHFCSGGWGGG